MKNQLLFRLFAAGVLAFALALTSAPAQSCVAPPAGLVSWWRAEGNATDAVGVNNGTLVNGAGFAVGKVGQAFSFNGNNQIVSVPNVPSLNPTNGFTLETWVYIPNFPN